MKGAKTYEQLQEQLDEYILSHNMRPSKDERSGGFPWKSVQFLIQYS